MSMRGLSPEEEVGLLGIFRRAGLPDEPPEEHLRNAGLP